jgi:hypothetical protein
VLQERRENEAIEEHTRHMRQKHHSSASVRFQLSMYA